MFTFSHFQDMQHDFSYRELYEKLLGEKKLAFIKYMVLLEENIKIKRENHMIRASFKDSIDVLYQENELLRKELSKHLDKKMEWVMREELKIEEAYPGEFCADQDYDDGEDRDYLKLECQNKALEETIQECDVENLILKQMIEDLENKLKMS